MRFSTAAGLLALLGIAGYSAPGGAQDLVERMRQATGVKGKPAAKPAAKSKAKSKPKPKPKAKPKPAARKASKPSPKAPAPAPQPEPTKEPAASEATKAAEPAKPASSTGKPPTPASSPSPSAPAPTPPAAPAATPAALAPALSTAPLEGAPSESDAANSDAHLPGAASSDGAAPGASTATSTATSTTAASTTAASNGAASDTSPSPLQLALFVDAYASWQSSGAGTLATLSEHRAFSGQGSTLRAENGFGLAFVGLDVSYDTPHVGATANLRFGEGVPIYHAHPTGESDAAFGVELLTQAYLTWRPWQVLALDLGMFDTPFGAEVLESWKNLNYTRGALYYYAQPGWHSGLRAQWDVNDALALVGFIANGSNIISETQQDAGLSQTPTLGAQVGLAPSEALWLAAGGLFTTDGYDNDDSGFDALGDVVLRFERGPLQAVLNANYVLTRNGAPDGSDRHFFGASAAGGYAFSERFGVAARGEWLLDDANYDEGERDRWRLFTVTLTTEYRPLAAAPHLIVRWDNRWEESNQQVFGKAAHGTVDPDDDSYADVWFQSVLGVVVTTTP